VKKLDRHSDLPVRELSDRHTARMLWYIRYRIIFRLLRLLVRCGLDELDLENAMLRHQLKILRRRGGRRLLLHHGRSGLPGGGGPGPVPRLAEELPGRPGHAGEMAPRPPEERARARLAAPRSPSTRFLDQAPDPSAGSGEPQVGLPQDQRGALKLGIDVSATTIATVLREGGLGPAPRRIGPTWTQFLRLPSLRRALSRTLLRPGGRPPGSPVRPAEADARSAERRSCRRRPPPPRIDH
jgi:hypothetical protein